MRLRTRGPVAASLPQSLFALCVAATFAGPIAAAIDAETTGQVQAEAPDRAAPTPPPSAPDERIGRERVSGEDPRDGRGPAQRRRLSSEQIEMVLDVAKEVFPDGAERLRVLRERDPAAFERTLGRQGRRLFALSMLRERNPDLYELKVEELRNQMQLRDLGARFAALGAETEANAAERLEIESTIRAIAKRQVDLGLRVRGLELAAMDEAIRRMRVELAADVEQRDTAVSAMVESVLSGRELPPPDLRSDPAPRGGWSGRGGRMERPDGEPGERRPRGEADRPAGSNPRSR